MEKGTAWMGAGILAALIGMWSYGLTADQIAGVLFTAVVAYFVLRYPLMAVGFVLHATPLVIAMGAGVALFKAGSPWAWPVFVVFGYGTAIWMPAWGEVVYGWVERRRR